MDVSERTEQRVCATHGAYEARILAVAGREIVAGCSACVAERDRADEARRQRMAADAQAKRVAALWDRCGIPERFKSRTLESYVAAGKDQQKALRVARAYVDDWPSVKARGTCLIFSGQPGTGKTHLACAIAAALMPLGVAALFTTVSDAMRAIKRSYDPGSPLTESDAIRALVDPGLLILDEVGGSRGTEHEQQLLFDILNKRYERVRPSILLTNLDAAALREHLGERIMDRLREGGGRFVSFSWASHRH